MLTRGFLILALFVLIPIQGALAQESAVDDLEPPTDEYTVLVERAVDRLVDADAKGFKALLSRRLISTTEHELGEGNVDVIIKERFIPFFSDFQHLDSGANTTTTKDAYGSRGIAFFRSFTNTSGMQKPFAVYVLEEEGKLVVGNLLMNKTMSSVVTPKSDAER